MQNDGDGLLYRLSTTLLGRKWSLTRLEKALYQKLKCHQKIVDFYQQKKLEEDAVILPNTRAALEQAEIEQILIKRQKEHS